MSQVVAERRIPPEWPTVLSEYWVDAAEVVRADAAEDERPGRDSLGITGHVRRLVRSAAYRVKWTRSRLQRQVLAASLACGCRLRRQRRTKTTHSHRHKVQHHQRRSSCYHRSRRRPPQRFNKRIRLRNQSRGIEL